MKVVVAATNVAFFVIVWSADTLLLYELVPLVAGRTLSWSAAALIAAPATAVIQWIIYTWIGIITR